MIFKHDFIDTEIDNIQDQNSLKDLDIETAAIVLAPYWVGGDLHGHLRTIVGPLYRPIP